ncbi:AlwI family type II restriction endonuclease [Patescibacteria group bacterium AH-259-L07]|nr:AlwI family type II restriction endonuclease [Patescibacteria group bacterium AH-259-L07]
MKGLLNVLSQFDGKILSNALAGKIMGEIIKYGLYRPTKGVTIEIERKWGAKRISEKSTIGIELLSDKEALRLLEKNPQDHKEAGFERGWPSRFATIFDFAKELGFVYFWIREPIKFSKIGLRLAHSIKIKIKENNILVAEPHPEFEQQAFLNALAKSQRNNPFVRVLNENVPLVLLLKVIKKLNADKNFNNAGISKLELPLVIYWKDNDTEKLYLRIKKLRKNFGYSPSWETISDICRDEIMQGQDIKRSNKSIMVDYPDEFIRKMRLTGLISLRGGGRFIDINRNEQKKVNYVLKKYSKYKKYDTEKKYFKYISAIDKNLISFEGKQVTVRERDKFLVEWTRIYSWKQIKLEMLNLARKRLSRDDILKYLSNPIRLEFLTALAIKTKFPDIEVIPNYPVDDEGLPTSTAGGVGDKGDIECYEDVNGVLLEVTMSEGRIQTMMEVWPIARHLEEFSKDAKNSMCYFVAPSIFKDSIRQIEFVREKDNLFILPKTIKEFLDYIDSEEKLYHVLSV